MRTALLALCLICSVLPANRVVAQSADRYAGEPEMLIVVQPSSIGITGKISSAANEEILRDTTSRLFADKTARIELGSQAALPPGWALVTDLTLQALAHTRSATAKIGAYTVSVRGFTEDRSAWEQSAGHIRGKLPAGWTLDYQVEEVAAAGAMNRQCIEMFRTALRGRAIGFGRASAEVSTAAMPLLDELIQIAVDCPESRIEITGHTDNTGEESVNLALSQQRADSVAAYLGKGGIAASRVTATGVGSSRPLVDEDTVQARQLNRRIELALLFPEED